VLAGVATHAVDEFVVLHQTDIVEAADFDHRRTPKAREGAGYQLQTVDTHPCVPAEEVPDVFIGLEELPGLTGARRLAYRSDDSGDTDELGLTAKGLAHSINRFALEQGVAVDGDHDFGTRFDDGGIECPRLAAMRQPQPDDRRRADVDGRSATHVGLGEPESGAEHLRGGVGGAVVSDDDLVRRIRLIKQRAERCRQHGRFVFRRHQSGKAQADGGVIRRVSCRSESLDVPCGKRLQRDVIGQVRQADRPREYSATAEGEQEQRHPYRQHRSVNEHADRRRPGWSEPGREPEARVCESIDQHHDCKNGEAAPTV